MDTQLHEYENKPFLYRAIFGGSGNNTNNNNVEQYGGKPEGNNSKENSKDAPKETTLPENSNSDGNSGPVAPLVAKSELFYKINHLFLILFISVLIAIHFIKSTTFTKFAFGTETPDFDGEDYTRRWKQILKYTITFILLIILIHVLIAIFMLFGIIIYAWFYYHLLEHNPKLPIWNFGKKHVTEIFWEYTDSENRKQGLIMYYVLMFLAIIIMYVFYLVYTHIVKGYLKNMYYPLNNDEDKHQHKYIYQYALYIIIMMLLVLFLMNYEKLHKYPILFGYNILYIVIYILLTVIIIKYQMTKKTGIFIGLMIVLIFLSLVYKIPLIAMAKYMA